MKWAFRKLSIGRKLTLISVLTSTLVVVLVCLFFMVYALVEFRRGVVRELSVLAQIIGSNSTAALAFDDRFAAEEILKALRAKPNVISACIYGSNGDLFASYARDRHRESFPAKMGTYRNRFYSDPLEMFRPIVLDNETIGTVFLRYDIEEIHTRLKVVAWIAGFVFLVSSLIAFVLGVRLQRLISKPIVHLSQIAKQVSVQKDYSVRAVKETDDECGILIDGFNDMLTQIQKRDLALQRDQDELEKRIQERTVALMQEISDRKLAEEEKELIQTQLLQAQKMEAIGVLAGGVAHDFNNLLTAIQGWTELLMEEVGEQSSAFQDLKEILSATKRAADLTQQLLLFSRKKSMRMVPVNLNQLLNGLLKICSRLIGENIEILTDFDHDLNTVKADRGTIEQVAMNLVVNAKDAMPNGGKIVIKTRNILIDGMYCKKDPEARPGRFVQLTVTDNGMGMGLEIQKHIFEPFFTTKGVGKGTGLGLSVIYGIVKQHDGWINVYSEVGHGSTFKIYLPVAESELMPEPEEHPPLESFQGAGERLLVVEDEMNVAEFNKKALTMYGYQVFLSKTLDEARQIFQSEHGNFSLVFSDVVLPDGSGIELVNEFLYMNPGLRVILSSGYTDHKLQWPVIQEKGYRFLQKPYSLSDLLKTIREEVESVHPIWNN